MPNITPVLALLKKPIDDVYDVTKDAIKDKVQQLRAQSKIKLLYTKLSSTQKVKTIWNIDRPLSLASIFYPVSVQRQQQPPLRINSLEDFPDKHIVIAGTGGQGKSFLLRYLLGKEIRSGLRIPLLFELRYLSSESLIEKLAEALDDLLGMKSDGELFTHFASAGKLSILLDGFDEIEPSQIARVGEQIQRLSELYPQSRLVIASRPDSGAEFLRTIVVQNIAPLAQVELTAFYKKITRDEEFTNRLVAAIKISPVKIKELVKTPLLATLLAMSYKTSLRIPPDFVEFYEQLFQVLFVRHDASKTGFTRNRKSKITDREIQLVFEAFCFQTRKKNLSSLTWSIATDVAESSIKALGLTADPSDVLSDIQKISCLLIKDGAKVEFAHKSVQEYFAARFIKSRPDSVAKKIYSAMLAGRKWNFWYGEIVFLEQIDRYRACQYFIIPDIEATTESIAKGAKEANLSTAEYLGSILTVQKRLRNVQPVGQEVHYVIHKRQNYMTQHFYELEQRLFSRLFGIREPNRPSWSIGFSPALVPEDRTYWQIAKDMDIQDAFIKVVEATLDDFSRRQQSCKLFLARENDASEFASI